MTEELRQYMMNLHVHFIINSFKWEIGFHQACKIQSNDTCKVKVFILMDHRQQQTFFPQHAADRMWFPVLVFEECLYIPVLSRPA